MPILKADNLNVLLCRQLPTNTEGLLPYYRLSRTRTCASHWQEVSMVLLEDMLRAKLGPTNHDGFWTNTQPSAVSDGDDPGPFTEQDTSKKGLGSRNSGLEDKLFELFETALEDASLCAAPSISSNSKQCHITLLRRN